MTGHVKSISSARTNADLIVHLRSLGYLRDTDRVLDPTYGKGAFWTTWRPKLLTWHDLRLDGQDFRALPYDDRVFDSCTFDPPYKLCLDDETEVLTRRGWLTCDEVVVDDLVWALDHDSGTAGWRHVTAVNIYASEATDVAVCSGKNLDFVATLDHRWPVICDRGRRVWRTTSTIRSGDRIVHAAPRRWASSSPVIDDALVELVAWYWTEGTLDHPSTYGHITQSHAVNAENCASIEQAFRALFGPPTDAFPRVGRGPTSDHWRVRDEERNRRFVFSASIGATLERHAPAKVPTVEFLESLTAGQLDRFIEVSLLADGSSSGRLAQVSKERAEAFALACIFAGRAVTAISDRGDGNGWPVHVKRRTMSKPRRPGIRIERRTVRVWCPTVEADASWLARRAGRIYFTGNSGRPSGQPVDSNYGITSYASVEDRHDLIRAGITECARVTARHLMVKCQDQVNAGSVRWQTREFADHAEGCGFRLVDMLFLVGGRQQPPRHRRCTVCAPGEPYRSCVECGGTGRVPSAQQHAARNYSTMLVLERLRPRRRPDVPRLVQCPHCAGHGRLCPTHRVGGCAMCDPVSYQVCPTCNEGVLTEARAIAYLRGGTGA